MVGETCLTVNMVESLFIVSERHPLRKPSTTYSMRRFRAQQGCDGSQRRRSTASDNSGVNEMKRQHVRVPTMLQNDGEDEALVCYASADCLGLFLVIIDDRYKQTQWIHVRVDRVVA